MLTNNFKYALLAGCNNANNTNGSVWDMGDIVKDKIILANGQSLKKYTDSLKETLGAYTDEMAQSITGAINPFRFMTMNKLTFSSYITSDYRNIYTWLANRDDYSWTTSKVTLRAGMIVGTGTTQPTLSDYKLENRLTTGYDCSLSLPDGSNLIGSKNMVMTLSITATENITINEIGYVRGIGEDFYVLLDRNVLETPLTIQTGETKSIEYKISI